MPLLGVYRWDAPDGPANVADFEQWLGRSVDLGQAFEATDTWDNIDGAEWQLPVWGQWVAAKAGRNLLLAVPMLAGPWDRSGPDGIPGNLDDVSFEKLIAGDFDIYWQNLADNLVANGLGDAYLRLGWEMDGGWYTWRAEDWGTEKALFGQSFARIVDTMRLKQPGANFKFVLNPTTNNWNTTYLADIWPGDGKVDVIGLDLYDQSWAADTYPYPVGADDATRRQHQINAWNSNLFWVNQVKNFAASKGIPMAFPEWGVCLRDDDHGGGDDPYFIRQMWEFINDPANNVAFHSYFNVSFAGDINARLTDSVTGDSPSGPTSFPQSAALFRQLFGVAPVPNTVRMLGMPRTGMALRSMLVFFPTNQDAGTGEGGGGSEPPPPATGDALLAEAGDPILAEDGSEILLEQST